jgi:hypothetical protein
MVKLILGPMELKESRSVNRRHHRKSKSKPNGFHSYHQEALNDNHGNYYSVK